MTDQISDIEVEFEEDQNVQEPQKKKKSNFLSRALRSIFGGEIFVSLGEGRIVKWLVIGLVLGILYIYNAYRIEKKSREIQTLQKEVKKLQYDYVEEKSKLMQYSRQSSLIEQLKEEKIKASIVPPRKLIKKND